MVRPSLVASTTVEWSSRSLPSLPAILPEHFCGKCLDSRAAMPGIRWQTRFAASLFQEGHTIPTVLYRHLRQEQATITMLADQQSMLADFDIFGSDGAERRQNIE